MNNKMNVILENLHNNKTIYIRESSMLDTLKLYGFVRDESDPLEKWDKDRQNDIRYYNDKTSTWIIFNPTSKLFAVFKKGTGFYYKGRNLTGWTQKWSNIEEWLETQNNSPKSLYQPSDSEIQDALDKAQKNQSSRLLTLKEIKDFMENANKVVSQLSSFSSDIRSISASLHDGLTKGGWAYACTTFFVDEKKIYITRSKCSSSVSRVIVDFANISVNSDNIKGIVKEMKNAGISITPSGNINI